MSGRKTQLKRALGFTALLAAGIVSALATGAGASAVPGTTTAPPTPTSTVPLPPTTTTTPRDDDDGRLTYKLLVITNYSGDCVKFPKPYCVGPLSNSRVKLFNSKGVLIRNVWTNAKGRVYINFPPGVARYTLTINHAPIKSARWATKTYPLRTPLYGFNDLATIKLHFYLK